jgi:hypothetical protein
MIISYLQFNDDNWASRRTLASKYIADLALENPDTKLMTV